MCDSRRPANGADSLPFDEPPMPDAAIDELSADGAQESPPRFLDERRGLTYDDFEPDEYRFGDAWADIESAIWERE